jgi:hypothetical protein
VRRPRATALSGVPRSRRSRRISDLASRGSDAGRRAHPLTSTHHPRNARNRLARRPKWCLVSSPRAHPRAPRPPRDGLRPPRRPKRVSPRTAPEASSL